MLSWETPSGVARMQTFVNAVRSMAELLMLPCFLWGNKHTMDGPCIWLSNNAGFENNATSS